VASGDTGNRSPCDFSHTLSTGAAKVLDCGVGLAGSVSTGFQRGVVVPAYRWALACCCVRPSETNEGRSRVGPGGGLAAEPARMDVAGRGMCQHRVVSVGAESFNAFTWHIFGSAAAERSCPGARPGPSQLGVARSGPGFVSSPFLLRHPVLHITITPREEPSAAARDPQSAGCRHRSRLRLHSTGPPTAFDHRSKSYVRSRFIGLWMLWTRTQARTTGISKFISMRLS
jgi:hypothetical protein